MRKLVLAVCVLFVFAGCVTKEEPKPVEKKVVIEEPVVIIEEDIIVEEPVKKVKIHKKKRKVNSTRYRMLTNSIEVFAYKGRLRNVKTIDDKRLGDSFYLKGNIMSIEKIYTSKIGDKYGKIVNKHLLVSMDDLTPYKK